MKKKTITFKFGIGDKVYLLFYSTKPYQQNCVDCVGVGYFTTAIGNRQPCSTCHGCGHITKYTKTMWQVQLRTLTIGSMRYDSAQSKNEQFEYMCVETGIRSGTVYKEVDFFSSQEEAQKEADKRNIGT